MAGYLEDRRYLHSVCGLVLALIRLVPRVACLIIPGVKYLTGQANRAMPIQQISTAAIGLPHTGHIRGRFKLQRVTGRRESCWLEGICGPRDKPKRSRNLDLAHHWSGNSVLINLYQPCFPALPLLVRSKDSLRSSIPSKFLPRLPRDRNKCT